LADMEDSSGSSGGHGESSEVCPPPPGSASDGSGEHSLSSFATPTGSESEGLGRKTGQVVGMAGGWLGTLAAVELGEEVMAAVGRGEGGRHRHTRAWLELCGRGAPAKP
jgi:hypothetical protein